MTFEELIIQRFDADVPVLPVPPQLSRMRMSDHPFARTMAEVIEDMTADRIEADERPYVEAIERRRVELEASEDEISYRDYGAATRDGDQTAEEMYEGVARSRSVGHMCRRGAKPYRSSLLLLKLMRKIKPATCLELGTGLGISTAYEAAALELNGAGRLITLEGAPSIAELAHQTVEQLGHGRVEIEVGRFQDALDGVVARAGPVDFVFIDGHHHGPATVDYYTRILPALSDGAVVIFDDIRWSDSILDAWNQLKVHPSVDVSVDLVDIGICRTAATVTKAEHFTLA